MMMKYVKKAHTWFSLLFCNSAAEKAGGWKSPAGFSQCYRVNTGYYSLLRYLGSLPKSRRECLCSWQGTNDLPLDTSSVLRMCSSSSHTALSVLLLHRKTHFFYLLIYISFCNTKDKHISHIPSFILAVTPHGHKNFPPSKKQKKTKKNT